jgi:F0F1-type ATP synthase delta subunit
MNKLVSLVLGLDGQVNDDVAAQVLSKLSRPELKRFLAAFRLELKRRVVQVSVAGEPGNTLNQVIGRAYPGKALEVNHDEALGAGLKVRAGDDIVDASVHGYFRKLIGELGST